MKVLFVASEAVPFCKTGGLADVVGSLPRALAQQNVDARVILPHYRSLETANHRIENIAELSFPFDGVLQSAALQRVMAEGEQSSEAPAYLLDAPQYFERPELYGYDDDVLRFGFFCRAVLEALPLLGEHENFRPDILHCHDWHTGLLPVYASNIGTSTPGNGLATESTCKTICTIHNLVYQGLAAKEFLPRLGFDWSFFNYHQLEFYGKINQLKAGLVFSDAITTVSPTYAHEIQSEEQGAGLDGVLAEHAHQLKGILNGIDTNEWNPATDEYLAARFDGENSDGKKICKRDLQLAVGLPDEPSTPVIGMVSRLSSQKGFDLVAAALPDILAMGCQLVVLGAGDEYYMKLLAKLGKKFAGRAVFKLGVRDEALAHKIYAGADLFLMPSHYEPCGLSQMISLAYATVPVVRATGGLADTIQQFEAQTGNGNGFVFREYNTAAMLDAIRAALACYHSPNWQHLLRNTFLCDFSWGASARKYAELYRETLR